MIKPYFIALVLIGNLLQSTEGVGQGSVSIDHVVVLVHDLDSSTNNLKERGFTIKSGRLHKNGLQNKHIKFKDATSVELMTIVGEATDDLAKDYQAMLKKGEGGVYLALSGIKMDRLEELIGGLGVDYHIIRAPYWDYLVFDRNSELEHVFFIEYKRITNTLATSLTHQNHCEGISEIWIEGDAKLMKLLVQVGGVHHDEVVSRGMTPTACVSTSNGDVIIVPSNTAVRPRIRSVVFECDQKGLNW